MRRLPSFFLRAAALLVAGPIGAAGCAKTVAVDLTVVEPCDQKDQALNGVESYMVSSTGGEVNELVTFKASEGPQPLSVGLGDSVLMTIQAFADDVSASGASSSLPQAVGRTLPLALTERSLDVKSVVPVGLLDSFGRTTGADGECSSMSTGAAVPGRHGHTATYVPVLNQVLIYGGAVFGPDGSENIIPGSAELWDPVSGTFTPVEGATGRAYHAATALPDGRVVISGGFGVVSGQLVTLQSADIFDPATKTFRAIQLRQEGRAHHTSTLMAGANLLVLAGGCKSTGANDGCTPTQAGDGNRGRSTELAVTMETLDIKDLAAGFVAVPDAASLLEPRAFHQATSLENGTNTLLVVTGGVDGDGPVAGIEVFRANGGSLARVDTADLAGFPAGKVPARHAAVATSAQELLIIGGQTQAPGGAPSGPGSPDVFIFSTTGGGVNQTPIQLFNGAGRAGHHAALLADGSVLIIGGITAENGPTAEILARTPGNPVPTARVLARPLQQTRDRAAMAVLPNNQVLFTGGHTVTEPKTSSSSAELYFGR